MASSADVYTDPSEVSYQLGVPFYMPIDGHAVWAIALSSRSGTLLTAALSVMLTLVFLCLWNLACFIALVSSPKKVTSRRRFAALTLLWNSNDPMFGCAKMIRYAWHYLGSPEDRWFGLIWALVALIVFGGSMALGVVGPSLVQIGNAAPVQPLVTYYPADAVPPDYSGVLKVFGLQAPSFLRALGSVEASDVTKRKDLNIGDTPRPAWNENEPMIQIDYNYDLNGDDFGLQHGADLSMAVKGSCITEYGWDASDPNDDTVDVYRLWNSDDNTIPVDLGNFSIQSAPKALFVPHPDAEKQYNEAANVSFAIVPFSAHRASITASQTDPWYKTENVPAGRSFPFEATSWVQRKRPVLSCWQQDLWTYGDRTGNISSIRNLAQTSPDKVKVRDSLLEVLDLAVGMPMVVTLGVMSGDSALLSRTTSPNGVIDASASSVYKDMQRLILASYVKTQNVFVDTTMYRSDGNWPNVLLADNNTPKPGAGDFVIVSPQIQTFSMAGLITIVVVLGFLILVEGFITALIHRHHGSSTNPNDNKLMRFKALSALDLFRRIYERDNTTKQEYLDDEWHCESHWPDKGDKKNFYLRPCPNKVGKCKGHIAKTETLSSSPPEKAPTDDQPSLGATPPLNAGKGEGVLSSVNSVGGSPPVSPPTSPGQDVTGQDVTDPLLRSRV